MKKGYLFALALVFTLVVPCKNALAQTIMATNTVQSEETCQINLMADLPDTCTDSVSVTMLNTVTDNCYQFYLYKNNMYMQTGFVEAGDYVFINMHLISDEIGKFPFKEMGMLSIENTTDVHIALKDEEALIRALEAKELRNREVQELFMDDIVTQDDIERVVGQQQEMTYAEVLDKFAVKDNFATAFEGSGSGLVGICGTQVGEYNVVVKVIESGQLGEAQIVYSTDGGNTYAEAVTIPISGKLIIPNTGLTMCYDVAGEEGFRESDVYTAYVPDPNVKLIIKNSSTVATVSIEPINEGDIPVKLLERFGNTIKIEFLKSGTLGSAVFKLSLDGGQSWTGEMYVPDNGIYSIPEAGINLVFESTKINLFIEGSTVEIYAVRNNAEVVNDSNEYIIWLALAVTVCAGYCLLKNKLMSKMPSNNNYTIIR